MKYEAIVIGVSAGGLAALNQVLPQLGSYFPQHVMIVQHMRPDADNFLADHFNKLCQATVKEAEDKETPQPGTIYFAPANYHLMVEADKRFALSGQERVNFSRPSIDVLFETAAEAYLEKLVGVILTGANSDGTAGLIKIKNMGGLTVVQSPQTAEAHAMPQSAIENLEVDHIIPLDAMGAFLNSLIQG